MLHLFFLLSCKTTSKRKYIDELSNIKIEQLRENNIFINGVFRDKIFEELEKRFFKLTKNRDDAGIILNVEIVDGFLLFEFSQIVREATKKVIVLKEEYTNIDKNIKNILDRLVNEK